MQTRDLYLNQLKKKGAIGKPERPKKHPIWAAHPRSHLSTKYPRGFVLYPVAVSGGMRGIYPPQSEALSPPPLKRKNSKNQPFSANWIFAHQKHILLPQCPSTHKHKSSSAATGSISKLSIPFVNRGLCILQ